MVLPNYIDLAVLSAPSQLVACDVIPPLGNVDHSGIHIHLKWLRKQSPVKTPKQITLRYTQADFDKAHHLLDAVGWTFLDDGSDIDTMWNMWGGEIYGSYGGMYT